jgi:hypothetical protein
MDIGLWLKDWSTPLGALATLAAVIVALGLGVASIIQTQRLQKIERRERLLNEIIEWATDVGKPKYFLNFFSLISGTINEKDQIYTAQLGQASNTDTLVMRGKYISKIALIFTQDLIIAVENIRHDLEEHAKLITDWIDGKVTSGAIGEHDYALSQSSNKVIEEATKIKIKYIS